VDRLKALEAFAALEALAHGVDDTGREERA